MKRLLAAAILATTIPYSVQAGDLNPPGAPAPTMVTLDQINAAIAAATSAANDAELAANAAEAAAVGAQDTRTPIDSLPGNANSLHVISAPGSYYLRGDIVGVSGMNGIDLASDFATIDLNGFELVGVAGSLRGIHMGSAGNRVGATVVNGRIRNWPGGGIINSGALGIGTTLRNVIFTGNGAGGANIGVNAIVRNCAFVGNTTQGLAAGGVIEGCVAQGNTGVGLNVGGSVRNCVSISNQNGMQGSGVFDACRMEGNTFNGLNMFDGSVSNCHVRTNGIDGISLFQNSLVLNNICLSNGTTAVGAGIRAQNVGNRIEGNQVNSNDTGIDCDVAGNLVIRNAARSNTDNYGQIVGGNDVGPIGTAAASTSPFANIAF